MKDYKEAIESIMKDTTSKVMDHAIKAYRQGYEDGQKEKLANVMIHDHEVAEKKAYYRGLNEAWDVAGKLFKVPTDALLELFERRNPYLDFSAQEVLAKIKAYEDKQKQDTEIKVGDEVIVQEDRIGFVTGYDVFLDRVYVATKDGWSDAFGRSFVKKTGRHFPEIAEVLAEMRGAENDK